MKIGHYLGCYWVKRGFRCFTGVDQCLGLHIDQFIAKCQPGCRPVPRPWHCLVCCQVSWPSPRLVSAVVSIIALATESLFSSSLRVLIINRHFRGLTVKFSLNLITTQKMANLEKMLSHTCKSSCLATLMVLIIKATFRNSDWEILTQPH